MRRCVEGGEGHCAQQAACILRARQRGRAFWRRWRASRGAYPSDRKNCCGAKLEVAQRANGRLSSGSACADLAASSRRPRIGVEQRTQARRFAHLPAVVTSVCDCTGLAAEALLGARADPPGVVGTDPTRRAGVFANVCRPTSYPAAKAEMGACLSYSSILGGRVCGIGRVGTWVWSRGTHPPRIIGEMNTCCACATTTLNRTLTAVSKAARRRCGRHMHTAGRRCRTDTVARSAYALPDSALTGTASGADKLRIIAIRVPILAIRYG